MSGRDVCSFLMFLAAVSCLNDCQSATRFWQGFIEFLKALFFALAGFYFAGLVKLP